MLLRRILKIASTSNKLRSKILDRWPWSIGVGEATWHVTHWLSHPPVFSFQHSQHIAPKAKYFLLADNFELLGKNFLVQHHNTFSIVRTSDHWHPESDRRVVHAPNLLPFIRNHLPMIAPTRILAIICIPTSHPSDRRLISRASDYLYLHSNVASQRSSPLAAQHRVLVIISNAS